MGKKKLKNEKIFEIKEAQSGLRRKKKAIQYDCPHKDHKGNVTVKYKNDSEHPYLFKCKQCRAKIDLAILNTEERGELKDQLKGAKKTIESFINLAKIQSNKNDKEILKIFAETQKRNDITYRLLKKLIKPNIQNKKRKKHRLNVSYGSKTLYN